MIPVSERSDGEGSVHSVPQQPRPASKSSGQTTGGRTFPKSARLLKHADFDKVYKDGRRHFSANMTVFYLGRLQSVADTSPVEPGPDPETGARIGITVGRGLGGAIVRNRIKRRIRETARKHRQILTAPVDVVINPKKSALKTDFAALALEVRQVFEVIESSGTNASRRKV